MSFSMNIRVTLPKDVLVRAFEKESELPLLHQR
jgi:hypothetical protein